MKRIKHTESGMGMVELLVAMAVAVIALTGMLSMYVTAARANAVARDQAAAVALAAGVVEDLRAMSIDEIATAYGEGEYPIVDHPLPVETVNNVEFTPYVSMLEIDGEPDLVLTRVRMAWTERGAARGAGYDHDVAVELVRTKLERL